MMAERGRQEEESVSMSKISSVWLGEKTGGKAEP